MKREATEEVSLWPWPTLPWIDRAMRMRCRKRSGLIRTLSKFNGRTKRWGVMASSPGGLKAFLHACLFYMQLSMALNL